MSAEVDWTKICSGRSAADAVLPPFRKTKILNDHRLALLANIKKGQSLLDFGSNNKALRTYLINNGVEVEYRSLDIDSSNNHDYYDIDQVDQKFDCVAMFEVVEHIPLQELIDLVKSIRKLIKPGGSIVVSTPNVFHPVRFWRDSTHITPLVYDDLSGILLSADFSAVEVFRVHKMTLKNRIYAFIFRPLLNFMGVDFAKGIVIVGKTNL